MPDKKNLGAYWGNNALYFVETQGMAATNLFQVPFSEAVKEAFKDGATSIQSMEFGSETQKILREQGLSNSPVNLSLPAKDIIFRSFVIPWMEEHEIKNVVEFEASKYIPFSLEKLTFSFYPINFMENNAKRLRIIFVAIKTDTLSNYIKILERASLHINLIEPAPSSMIRALSLKLKSVIPKNQTIAFIEKEDVGRITIVDNNIPQFVREFHLSPVGSNTPAEGAAETIIKRLTGEVRISLDYFNRQNEQLQVTHGIFLSGSNLDDLIQTLDKNLPISIIPIDDQTILGDPTKKELGYLNAYGVSIISSVESPVYFNLFRKSSQAAPKLKVSVPRKPANYKLIIAISLICIPLIIASVSISGILKQNLKENIEALNQKLGRFQDTDISTIEQKEQNAKEKLAYFKNIRMDSNAGSFLLLIPNLLPEGTWVNNLDIVYDDSASFDLPSKKALPVTRKPASTNQPETATLTLTIEGYTYSENRNQQFRLVNQFLRNLKDNTEFSSFFSVIDVETTKAQKLNDFSVTAFKIVCKQNNESQRSE